MLALRNFTAATLIALTAGCATGLNSAQEAELAGYRARNLAVEEKSPGLAAGLGILPGGGSFYGRAYGLGVVNLLMWPLSIIWDPISGSNAVELINYEATKAKIESLKTAEMEELNNKRYAGQIAAQNHSVEKGKIEVSNTGKSKDELLDELVADKSLSYEEYERRYKIISKQQP